jgi:hypothetical protein
MTGDRAQFWAVDSGLNTPGSSDTKDDDFGTADDIVRRRWRSASTPIVRN